MSLVRDADGSYPLVYGTLVDAPADATHLPRDAFRSRSRPLDEPGDRRDVPRRLARHDPGEDLTIDLRPTVADQELDTRRVDRRRLLGGLAGRVGRRAADPAGRRGLRRADGLRSVGERRQLRRGNQAPALRSGRLGSRDRDARAGGDVVELGVERARVRRGG
jgi:hypothetical protein